MRKQLACDGCLPFCREMLLGTVLIEGRGAVGPLISQKLRMSSPIPGEEFGGFLCRVLDLGKWSIFVLSPQIEPAAWDLVFLSTFFFMIRDSGQENTVERNLVPI